MMSEAHGFWGLMRAGLLRLCRQSCCNPIRASAPTALSKLSYPKICTQTLFTIKAPRDTSKHVNPRTACWKHSIQLA